MPTEFAYPERLCFADQSLQSMILAAVVVMFFLPLAREIFRPGSMNAWDVWLGAFSFIAALCVPQAIEHWALGRLRAELQMDEWIIRQIWMTATWTAAGNFAYYAMLIHGGWLLTGVLLSDSPRSYKVLQTIVVYLLPFPFCCVPSMGHPRDVWDFSKCHTEIHGVILALHMHEGDNSHFPPFKLSDAETPRSWRVELLPYMDQAPLRKTYEDTQLWNAPPNDGIAKKLVERLHCSGNYQLRDAQQRYYTAFAGVVGPNTFFAEDGHSRRFPDFTDGTSSTLAIVEACGANIVWTEPRDLRLSEIEIGVNRPGATRGTSRGLISSCHPHRRGGHVAFVDGSVRFISEDVDPELLAKLLTINGAEVAPLNERGEIRWK